MTAFNVKIAKTVFRVRFDYTGTGDRLKNYRTDEPAQYTVTVEKEDLEKAYQLQQRFHPDLFDDDYIHSFRPEFSVLHRKISRELLRHDTLLVHGSCVVADGSAYLFIAPSGTGKSTHTRHWLSLLGSRAYIINDDKPEIFCGGGVPVVYGTPWGLIEDALPCDNAPLRAVAVLKRGSENRVREISCTEMFVHLFKASLRGETPDELKQSTLLQNRLISSVKCFELTCTDSIESARLSYRALTGNPADD